MAASRVTTLCGAAAALVGVTVLAGWWLDLSVLKSVLPGHVSMKPNTALGFALAGAALLLLSARPASPRSQRVGRWLALLVVLIGGLTLSEYVFGWRPGIDELLFKDDPNAAATLIPGRMAPSTAFSFLLLGLALLGIGWEPRRGRTRLCWRPRRPRWASWMPSPRTRSTPSPAAARCWRRTCCGVPLRRGRPTGRAGPVRGAAAGDSRRTAQARPA